MSKEGFSRRRFLTVAGTAAGAAVASQLPFSARARTAPVRFTGYPFTLGVASGDPTPDGAVLWTRLAPAPLSGNGGMPDKPVAVQWEVANDEAFANVVARGEETAVAADAHSVHAEPQGLLPGREYFYRFKANGEISPVGRTKTAPAGAVSALAFAFASCQQYEHGYYTAYKHMAAEDLDLVIHVGDYIYEYDTGSYTSTGGNVRGNSNHEIVNLADYRERHAQYKTDPDLQAAHAAFPWLVTFDDHEVDNNWADEIPEEGMPHDWFMRRRQGRVPRLLGAHAAAQGGQADRHQHPDLPARRVREPGHVPRARHAPVPLRSEQRPHEPGAHDHRGAAGAVALRRAAGLAGDVADPRQPGLHGAVGLPGRRRRELQHATPGTATRSRATSS